VGSKQRAPRLGSKEEQVTFAKTNSNGHEKDGKKKKLMETAPQE